MHSICGKLNKPARTFQAGESSTGFGIRLGVKFRDPKTKEDAWTNYQAVIFAKSPGQIQFYQNVLVEGAIVEVSAEQLKVDSFDGQNGQVLTIDMLNARLGYVHAPQAAQHQQAAPQQQGGYQQAPAQQPAQKQGGFRQQAPQHAASFDNPAPAPQQQGGYQQPAQRLQQQSTGNTSQQFDDDIPF